MSDGCVCLGGGDWDEDQAAFCAITERKARKPHTCCECRETIPAGKVYEHVSGKWDGDLYRAKTCLLCREIRDSFACNGGFTYATLWEDLREIVYPQLTMCCLSKLSIEAQRKIASDYSKWAG